MAKNKKNNISVDGMGFHRGELARYDSADAMVQALKADKTFAHIFEQDGGEAALRTAYEQAAPKKEVVAEVSGDGSGTALPEIQEPEVKGRAKNSKP